MSVERYSGQSERRRPIAQGSVAADEALTAAITLETLARQYLLARAAGTVRLLTATEMQAARERFKTYAVASKAPAST